MTRRDAIKEMTLCIDWAEQREESCCDCVPVELLVTARNLLERQEGKWIESDEGLLICSRCGRSSEVHDECISGQELDEEFCEIFGGRPKYIFALKRPRYCWNCGAFMMQEEEK